MYHKEAFENLILIFDEKQAKKLQLPTLMRLINKLIEHNIEDESITQNLSDLSSQLNDIHNGHTEVKRPYKKAAQKLISDAMKTHGLTAKGTYIGLYMAIGIAIGTGIGTAFSMANPSFIAIGSGAGIAFGVALGSSKEQKIDANGLLY